MARFLPLLEKRVAYGGVLASWCMTTNRHLGYTFEKYFQLILSVGLHNYGSTVLEAILLKIWWSAKSNIPDFLGLKCWYQNNLVRLPQVEASPSEFVEYLRLEIDTSFCACRNSHYCNSLAQTIMDIYSFRIHRFFREVLNSFKCWLIFNLASSFVLLHHSLILKFYACFVISYFSIHNVLHIWVKLFKHLVNFLKLPGWHWMAIHCVDVPLSPNLTFTSGLWPSLAKTMCTKEALNTIISHLDVVCVAEWYACSTCCDLPWEWLITFR